MFGLKLLASPYIEMIKKCMNMRLDNDDHKKKSQSSTDWIC